MVILHIVTHPEGQNPLYTAPEALSKRSTGCLGYIHCTALVVGP